MSKKEKAKNEERSLPTVEAVKAEIKREKIKHLYKKLLKSTIYTLIVVAAIAVLIATFILPVVQITGTSMEPGLSEGEIVVLIKTKYLERGDVCAFYYSNKVLIKRVIGLPGDYIEMDVKGNIYVNGEAIDEPYLTEKAFGECDLEFPYQVPESQYFLLGDQRATSIDSRSSVIGCVSYDQMVGKLVLKVWPFEEISFVG